MTTATTVPDHLENTTSSDLGSLMENGCHLMMRRAMMEHEAIHVSPGCTHRVCSFLGDLLEKRSPGCNFISTHADRNNFNLIADINKNPINSSPIGTNFWCSEK